MAQATDQSSTTPHTQGQKSDVFSRVITLEGGGKAILEVKESNESDFNFPSYVDENPGDKTDDLDDLLNTFNSPSVDNASQQKVLNMPLIVQDGGEKGQQQHQPQSQQRGQHQPPQQAPTHQGQPPQQQPPLQQPETHPGPSKGVYSQVRGFASQMFNFGGAAAETQGQQQSHSQQRAQQQRQGQSLLKGRQQQQTPQEHQQTPDEEPIAVAGMSNITLFTVYF